VNGLPLHARSPHFFSRGVEHVEHRTAYLADLHLPERRLDRPSDVPLKTRPGGQIPLGYLRILIEQLGDGRAGLRLAPGRYLLEQLAELDLRGKRRLARLPEPDLATGQRVLPGVHLHAPGSAGESLYVSGWSSSHDITVRRTNDIGPRTGPRDHD
jgi:hypothetical protein